MRTLIAVLALGLLVLGSGSALAQRGEPSLEDLTEEELAIEARKAGYQIAKDFSLCAALYDSLRDFTMDLGEPDMAQVFNDQSNGAEVVAEVFAKVYAQIEKYSDFVKGQYDSEYPRFRALLRNGGADENDIQTAMAFCQSLQPIQSQVVEEVRKKAYGADTSGNQWVN